MAQTRCRGPPSDLLSRVQTVLIDFFWDRLHWPPQVVLFLPKEERGRAGALDQQEVCFQAPIHSVAAILSPRPGLEATGSADPAQHQRPGITGVRVFTGF